eukprot:TRINITY_DN14094_c0_g1_i1.p1 TRINITY_DN14094_c0_g1~~TRINITY_DN14094_c0_g1_i1.p1  ORF type:complete len:395 (+),score=92.06 TRINITY_DN14094_c0_g1_i1:117-1301(+)
MNKENKKNKIDKLINLIEVHNNMVVINFENINSNSLKKIRKMIRDKQSELYFEKNTIIKKMLKEYLNKKPQNNKKTNLKDLFPYLKGNIAILFTNQEDIKEIVQKIESVEQTSSAKVGQISHNDVFLEKGPTGLAPTQTSFLQSLNISTKIIKGQVEVLNNFHLLRAGEIVRESHVSLLEKLKMKPFVYKPQAKAIFASGYVSDALFLKFGRNEVFQNLSLGLQRIATISIETNIPCLASIPHFIAKAFKNMVDISIQTNCEFKETKQIKQEIYENILLEQKLIYEYDSQFNKDFKTGIVWKKENYVIYPSAVKDRIFNFLLAIKAFSKMKKVIFPKPILLIIFQLYVNSLPVHINAQKLQECGSCFVGVRCHCEYDYSDCDYDPVFALFGGDD